MNRPRFRPDESNAYNFHNQNVTPRQNEFRGLVSYPPRYYSRPPRPTDYGTYTGKPPQRSAAVKPKPDFQTNQQKTLDNAVKKNASEEHADVSIPATSGSSSDDLEQLKWRPGQGPIVDLRLLVPGRVCLLI